MKVLKFEKSIEFFKNFEEVLNGAIADSQFDVEELDFWLCHKIKDEALAIDFDGEIKVIDVVCKSFDPTNIPFNFDKWGVNVDVFYFNIKFKDKTYLTIGISKDKINLNWDKEML